MTPSVAKLKAKGLIYLSGGGGMLIFILLILILPYHYKLKRIDVEIENKKKDMAKQMALIPCFQKIRRVKKNINEIRKETKFNEPTGLPLPSEAKLLLNETEKAFQVFRKIAERNYFQVDAVVEADSNTQDDYLLVIMKIKGDFLNFYNFFLQLNQIPYLAHIEQVQIRTIRNVKEIYLKIWLAMEN